MTAQRPKGRGDGVGSEADELLASLATPAARRNPYPVFARLRALGPAHRISSGGILLTRYAGCAAVMRDPEYRSQSPAWADRIMPAWRDSPGKVATFEAMLFRDPPDHTRLRKLVSAAFSPRRVDSLRGEVAFLAGHALDMLADAGRDGGTVDLQEILASCLAMPVIGKLVGVPEADWAPLRALISALLGVVELFTDTAMLAEADRAAVALDGYFADLVAERRHAPRDDLASALIAARDGRAADAGTGGGNGGSNSRGMLTERELLQTLTFVFMAGVDTMINLLTNGTAALLNHPAQADLLRADPGLADGAVEEALRYDPPVQFAGRVPITGTAISGVPVPADSLVIAMLGAANRDPARFADPETFDISRTGTTVLSFGGGIHYCLGAPLARVEAETFFRNLTTRFPRLRLSGEPRRSGVVFRGFSHLPVAIH
jgi:cytochrome P450